MSTKTALIVAVLIIIIGTIASVMAYPGMPEMSASHWNASGQVDGYMPRLQAAFMMPMVTVILLVLFMAIPSIDPLKANIAQFRETFNTFIVLIVGLMLLIHGATLAWNLGYNQFDMGQIVLPGVGVIFIVAGNMMRKAKRNFFIGIRTPWTLSSDYVWDETHKLGSWLFMAAGVVSMISFFFGKAAIWIFFPMLLIAGLVPMIYSYILFARLSKNGQ